MLRPKPASPTADPAPVQLSLFGSPDGQAPVEERGATLSPCGTYRYALWRFWDGTHATDAHRAVVFVGLNPSTADAQVDDPTIRRCRRFAQDWGYPGMVMLNLFAYRATEPRVMKGFSMAGGDAVGCENDKVLQSYRDLLAQNPPTQGPRGMVVFAWGQDGGFRQRSSVVESIMKEGFCLGTTKAGDPRHPLYIAASQRPLPFIR